MWYHMPSFNRFKSLSQNSLKIFDQSLLDRFVAHLASQGITLDLDEGVTAQLTSDNRRHE